ncbi:hypothetical protein TNCV_4505241 [Trichonephila clavipes]|nr:hypothetical protein TNCV_4505241 [Trichonephila clavipes]
MLPVLGKKAVLEWCMKEALIGSSYGCPKCGKNSGTALVSPTHPTWRKSIGAPKTPIHAKDRVYKQG